MPRISSAKVDSRKAQRKRASELTCQVHDASLRRLRQINRVTAQGGTAKCLAPWIDKNIVTQMVLDGSIDFKTDAERQKVTLDAAKRLMSTRAKGGLRVGAIFIKAKKQWWFRITPAGRAYVGMLDHPANSSKKGLAA